MPVQSSKKAKNAKPVKAAAKSAPKMGKAAPGTKLGKFVKKIQGAYMKAKAAKPVAKKAAAAKPAPKAPAKAVVSKHPVSAKAAPAKAPAALKKPAEAAPAAKAKVTTPAPLKAAPAPVKAAPAAKAGRGKGAGGGTGLPRTSLRASKANDLSGEAVCREVACEGLSTTAGYCRMHYIKNWKKIKRKELILKEGKLNQYIEELVSKYPDKYMEAIRQDLAEDKSFAKVIYDLDLDEGVDDYDPDGENVDSVIESIKRDFDDDTEGGF